MAGATKQRLFGRRKIPAKVRETLLEQLHLQSWSELLIDIGLGKRIPDLVARQIAQLTGERPEGKAAGDEALVIRGSEGIMVTYSKCCSPVPGDSIVGILTTGHGLAIHVLGCPNLSELRKHPENMLLVDWHENIDQNFHARLHVKLHHISGAFAEVAMAIAENGSNINHVELHDGSDTVRQIDFVVDVKDRVHLSRVIKAIYRKPSVSKVMRQKG